MSLDLFQRFGCMNYDNRVTGKVIKALRRKKGLTQDVLSGLAGIGRSHLAMIESGEKNANVDTLWRIADALGIRLSKLIAMVETELNGAEGIQAKERKRAHEFGAGDEGNSDSITDY